MLDYSSSIYPLLYRTGGIRPPVRKRSRLALTLVEHEEISRGIVAQQSIRSMAALLEVIFYALLWPVCAFGQQRHPIVSC